MKKVVILKIAEYELELLKEKIKAALLQHFSLHEIFRAQDRILLKPNLLMPAQPPEAIITHPVFVEALGLIFKEIGADVFIADSKGGGGLADAKDSDDYYEQTQILGLALRNGFKTISSQESIMRRDLPLCSWVEGFKMINLPKLKTHSLTVLTLATKNLYGCISGVHKSYLHRTYARSEDFAKIITKLYTVIKPALNVVDGILAMEGNGPGRGGKPKKLGIVVISDDTLAADYAIGRLLGLDAALNPLIVQAKKEGLFVEEDVEVISEVDDEAFSDFEFPPPFIVNRLPNPLLSLAKSLFKFKPRIDLKKCTGCGVCVSVCPNSAITIKAQKASINHKKCIMCMCCVEMCPCGAVNFHKSLGLKILSKMHG